MISPQEPAIMSKPSSFCTICTHPAAFELVGLLLSLSVFHPNAPIIVISDSRTKFLLESITPQPKLQIKWIIMLNKYSDLSRATMEKQNIWAEFQMFKAAAIQQALDQHSDTLFLDSDIIVTGVISSIDKSKDLGVSPHYMKKEATDKYGYYNGGMLWTKHRDVPRDWLQFTQTSRFFDQASIEDLAKKYSHFSFGENYNIQGWRIYHHPDGRDAFVNNFSFNETRKQVYYKNSQIKCIHTHLRDKTFDVFNNLLFRHFQLAKMYKIVAIMFRVLHGNWILRIPKQPMSGLASHSGDSFRELARLMAQNNSDVKIVEDTKTTHCWLAPTILLYDRPTLQWCNEEVRNATYFFLGNGSTRNEGSVLQERFPTLPVSPWIFWPRRPSIVEDMVVNQDPLYYDQRPCESVFIGNYENNVQKSHRTKDDWSTVIEEFHCTNGSKHKFTPSEYLMKLKQAKYGLCLRGFGSKCHREVELMAFGTVPIVTSDVCIDSYLNPPQENVHYIRVDKPADLRAKLDSIDKDTWEKMSDACFDWFQENGMSDRVWNLTIRKVLYDEP